MIGKVLPFAPRRGNLPTQTTSLTSIDFRDRLDYSGQDIEAQQAQLRFNTLFIKLNKVFAKASHADWDGEGANPVALSAYQLAVLFIYCLPTGLTAPEIIADNDGYIEFEWYKDEKSFSIYVTGTDVMLYAAYYGPNDRLSGRFTFKEKFPDHLEPFIRRVTDDAQI